MTRYQPEFAAEYELEPAHRALLTIADALMAEADESDAQVRADGRMIPGSTGQMVEHPGVRTAIVAREKAARIYRDLFPDEGPSAGVDAASLGQSASGQAHRSAQSVRASEAARKRWDRARAVEAAL
ncbi:hypothetical protein I5Q34_27685 [Streptomyces sp. AV19]|uniref:hypothetical protein n=1 Tax=Streptomyces sp. AV19 TaxID=2793068 RepID=UPI0018FF067A|nr:hypothetical protein [Streptomyces sp. AV19]MBH1938008.1 hypothetical protein [Streptomyces sp. AV19]MDG4536623.1 hypothetical protein [Streptomyces sp. AV19]